MANLKPQKVKKVESPKNLTETKDKFIRHIIHENAIATNDIRSEKFDMDKVRQKSRDAMTSMCVNGGLQSMLAAQMYSIHELQQKIMIYANATDNLEPKR